MMFRKPRGVKYTDMAIWIDNNAYSDHCDDEQMYEYLFHLANMLAWKSRYFNDPKMYDEYALFVATKVYMRYRDPRQFSTEGKKLKVLKSSLNYLKKIIYPYKVLFEHENYAQVGTGDDSEEVVDLSLRDAITGKIDELSVADFNMYLNDIPRTIRAFINNLPFKKNSVEKNNVYISCLLSFLNSITISEKSNEKIEKMRANGYIRQDKLQDMFEEANKDCVVLFHLDSSMHDYIKVLTNELRHLIFNDLSQILKEYIPTKCSERNYVLSVLDCRDGDVTDED